jgi:transcriptional pleiotropic regulator of transition state genes
MAEIASARRVDQLGRIVLPAELRRSLGIEAGDVLDFHAEANRLVLRKVHTTCALCGGSNELTEFHEKLVCSNCISELRNEPACAACGRIEALIPVRDKFLCKECAESIAVGTGATVDLTVEEPRSAKR